MNPSWLLISALLGGCVALAGSYWVNFYLPRKQNNLSNLRTKLDSFAVLNAKYWLGSWTGSEERFMIELEMKILLRGMKRDINFHLERCRQRKKLRPILSDYFKDLIKFSTGGCFDCATFETSSKRARRCSEVAWAIIEELR